jgi:hypothetical protein
MGDRDGDGKADRAGGVGGISFGIYWCAGTLTESGNSFTTGTAGLGGLGGISAPGAPPAEDDGRDGPHGVAGTAYDTGADAASC